MKLLFWVSLGVVVYTYAIYPCLLFILASTHQVLRDLRFALRRGDRRHRIAAELPSVSLVFSAYNEQSVIAAKMKNCARLEYPRDRLEVLVGCDGCTDGTANLAAAGAGPGTCILPFAARRGKPVVLNELVTRAKGGIVVFSDANTMLAPDALLKLTRHFSDAAVGCACGELRFESGGVATEGVYWRYEVFLKFLESRLNMLVGANGGLFAVRRQLFSTIPDHGIIDDFLIAMSVRMKGYRVVYDPEAAGVEEAANSVRDEFRRRVRIGAGAFYALRYTWRLLSPTAGLVSLAYWSHKVCRWMVPFALTLAFCAAVVLLGEPFYAGCLAAGLALSAMALVGYRLERRKIHTVLFGIPYYFISMNLALAFGFWRFLTGSQTVVWGRTAREKSAA